ncbi:MAG: hypothetical protein R3Y28_06090 [Candidatus Gastranaerophilales bacterium]
MSTDNNKTIYLHIGLQKTGTTTLQAFFYKNNDLFTQHGVFYPILEPSKLDIERLEAINVDLSITNLQVKQFDKAFLLDLTSNSFIEEFEKDFLEKIRATNCKKILLSEESFYEPKWTKSTLEPFVDYLLKKDFEIKIIVYVRPIADWVCSRWQQRGKNTLASLKNIIDSKEIEQIFDIKLLVKKMGKENVIIKPFEKCQWKNGSLIEDFLDIMDIELTDDFDLSAGDKNIGVGRNHLELFKIIYSLSPNITQQFKKKIIDSAPKERKLIETLTDEEILKIYHKFSPILKELEQIYGKESFFVNELPSCYGKKRPAYDNVEFTFEQLELLYEAIEISKTEKQTLIDEKDFYKKEYLKPNFLQKIFSVKNEGNHKVLRILGVKVKFKRKDKSK